MGKRQRIGLLATVAFVLALAGALCWFVMGIFEGGKPVAKIEPVPEYLTEETAKQKFYLHLADPERGLRSVKVSVKQGKREIPVFSQSLPFQGLFNRDGARRIDAEFFMDLSKLNLEQGRAELEIQVRDYSRRGGGEGNLTVVVHGMTVDTIPPDLRALSRQHYVNLGGSGLAVYETSPDTRESGIYVNGLFFPGYPAGSGAPEGVRVSYFAVPYDAAPNPHIFLWARDKAGNVSKKALDSRVLRKKFRSDRLNITEGFLNRILPYFSFYAFDPNDTEIDKFLKINRQLREQDEKALSDLGRATGPERLWDQVWVRLRNAETMARFADRRTYLHKGREIDEQVHLGVDLASLVNSPVQAANRGRVVFAGRMGIYGSTVVLDHGQGVSSLYAHLSRIDVQVGHEVGRGQEIGLTGQSGLAGGDHLHFGMMVQGVPVNPLEWWDAHWIQDNVTGKLALIGKSG